MARNHARILTSIWTDEDFLDMSAGAQRMFMLLMSQQNLSHAGLLPLTVKRWANKAKNTTPEQVEAWLAELVQRRYVVIDEATEELLIRSLMRRDDVWKHWKVMTAAANDVVAIASARLRAVCAAEVARMLAIPGVPEASKPLLERLQDALPKPTDTQPEPEPPRKGQGVVTEVSTGSPAPAPSPTSAPATSAKPPSAEVVRIRQDVEQVCARLADRMVANGCKRPPITDRWREAARLMLDRDGRPLADVLGLIDWSQADEFWRANVQSIPTFRKQYDRLRLQAQRGTGTADDRTRSHLELIERLAQETS